MLEPTIHKDWSTEGCSLDGEKKKCLESAHVSWILSQGRIRVLLWTEDNFKRAGRNLLSATVKRQRKLVYVQRGVGTDRRPCPHGASRGHCLYRCFWLTEPRQLYTFMQIELRGQQAWINTSAQSNIISLTVFFFKIIILTVVFFLLTKPMNGFFEWIWCHMTNCATHAILS